MPRATRWLVPLLLLAVWLGAGAVCGPYAGRLGEVSTNDQAAFLPRSAESTKVLDERARFDREESLPAVLVWTAEGGGRLDSGARAAATRALGRAAGADGVLGRPSPALPSKDGEALEGVVPLRPGLGDKLPDTLDAIRAQAEKVPGTAVGIAGPAATQADLSDAFAGIDGILLGVALVAVLVILLLVYRSVLMPFLVILSAVFALAVASALVYVLADHDIVRVDGQVRGILSILVIGAATDYALLLTARFREELTAHGDRFVAVRAALRRSAGAIAASGATVALGLLALLLSDLTNNRALGPVGALGIGCALLSAFTFLPAVLVLLGRAAYWPKRPTTGGDPEGRSGLWQRVAGWVDRLPRRLWIATTVALLALAAFAPTLRSSGVPLDETFVGDASSVSAQRTLDRHFPGGSGQPAVILTDADRADAVVRAARGVAGVDSAAPVGADGRPGGKPQIARGRVEIDATLKAAPDSGTAKDAVRALRTAVREAGGESTRVGGYTAQQIDTEDTAAHDRTLIVPVVLLIILAILIGLLRALLLPLLLVATVALNFAATLGVSSLVFRHVFGFTGTDASVPLYGFVFLVALGVDYNIFLMSRVREETAHHGPREGVLRGLVSTGGVITSAGVVLAATFAALGVIPLSFLAQIAFIVAFGVLMDTLVVRSLLVPALVRDLGARAWWPSRIGRGRREEAGRER
ncbi:MMPL family transporter [Streptomyces sp. NPDC047046]|uniref:MMPL family transporter n=1 Tax=Streptomyces sp. NPDC047046 TaxID=3155378 RepID=UPI0033D8ADAA